MPKKQWTYRPSDEEHELLMKAMEESPEFTSVAQFMREGVMRLIHDNDRRKIFSEVVELIGELNEAKNKFMDLVIRLGREE